jgi:hypothetical protein
MSSPFRTTALVPCFLPILEGSKENNEWISSLMSQVVSSIADGYKLSILVCLVPHFAAAVLRRLVDHCSLAAVAGCQHSVCRRLVTALTLCYMT